MAGTITITVTLMAGFTGRVDIKDRGSISGMVIERVRPTEKVSVGVTDRDVVTTNASIKEY